MKVQYFKWYKHPEGKNYFFVIWKKEKHFKLIEHSKIYKQDHWWSGATDQTEIDKCVLVRHSVSDRVTDKDRHDLFISLFSNPDWLR